MVRRTHHMITLSFSAYRELFQNQKAFCSPFTKGPWQKDLENILSFLSGMVYVKWNRAMKDALLTWLTQAVPLAQAEYTSARFRGCPEQPSCTFSPASTALRAAYAATAAHTDAPDAWQGAQLRYCHWAVKPTWQLRMCSHGVMVNHTWTYGVKAGFRARSCITKMLLSKMAQHCTHTNKIITP